MYYLKPKKNGLPKRFIALCLMTTLTLGLVSIASNAASHSKYPPVYPRKNIDKLSPTELEAYKHALRILYDRSKENVYDIDGFLWQSWVHNCSNLALPDKKNPNLWPKN